MAQIPRCTLILTGVDRKERSPRYHTAHPSVEIRSREMQMRGSPVRHCLPFADVSRPRIYPWEGCRSCTEYTGFLRKGIRSKCHSTAARHVEFHAFIVPVAFSQRRPRRAAGAHNSTRRKSVLLSAELELKVCRSSVIMEMLGPSGSYSSPLLYFVVVVSKKRLALRHVPPSTRSLTSTIDRSSSIHLRIRDPST